ncbi:MAG TPA: hypothetical protein VNN62_00405 [Methylomirabilota bacterium]|nr:hypothetical protein [Methylomirabilota bacterium]
MRKIGMIFGGGLLVVSLWSTNPAGAQSQAAEVSELEQLKQKIEELEQLKQRVEQLEKHQVAATVSPAQPQTKYIPADVQAAVDNAVPSFLKHFKLSTLIYGDWAAYPQTGWGPQFLTQINPPGPGNDNVNSFDITRTYLNLLWTPSERYTIRITPNIFREVGTPGAFKNSSNSSVGSNLNGNLTFRLKYGWFQMNDVLYKGQNVRIGQIENPLVPWEEDLYGFRFVNLVPLNFFAYSSTDLGIAALGPIRLSDTTYGDYWLGLYNGSSFHAAEFNEKRSPQGRITLYPFAKTLALAGLGFTGFGS